MNADQPANHWDEETSRRYINYGRYFVPARDAQLHIMLDLLRHLAEPATILELCCGEGLLAEMLLEGLPGSTYLGMDGSTLMLDEAKRRLGRFGERVRLNHFELADRSWHRMITPVAAVVSSLAIHHLDGEGKRILFRDMFANLTPGGAFILADMIEPATIPGRKVAADAWDDVVRQRSLELDGTTEGLDFFLNEGWNTYRYTDPDDIDHPSGLFDQLKWLEAAGFRDIDVHFMQAGHALFSGWKGAG